MTAYFEIISESSPHIYHSALALSPTTSIVRKLYAGSRAQRQLLARGVRIVYGRPVSWDRYTAAVTHFSNVRTATWSPRDKFIAFTSSESNAVDIRDSVTLQKLQSFDCPAYGLKKSRLTPAAIAFSPDGRTLTASVENSKEVVILSWDLQTGGVSSMIPWNTFRTSSRIKTDIIYSKDGKKVAVLYQMNHRLVNISICDMVSSKRTHNTTISKDEFFCGLWAHGESIRFAAINRSVARRARPKFITVWEVGFAQGIIKVETLPLPKSVASSIFSNAHPPPSLKHPQTLETPRLPVAFSSVNSVLVLDVRTSEILLDLQDLENPTFTCSSGGPFFACSVYGSATYLWKDSPTGYVLHGKLPSSDDAGSVLSPNGESLVTFSKVIKLWHTESLATATPDSIVGAPKTDSFLLKFLPRRSLAAVSRDGYGTVTLLDLKSGAPQLTINTGMEIRGIWATEDVVVAISETEATAWKLPEGSFHLRATMNVEDSVRTIEFSYSDRNTKLVDVSVSPDHRYILVKELIYEVHLYDATTGEHLSSGDTMGTGHWITPDGRKVGCIDSDNKGAFLEITAQGELVTRDVGLVDIGEGRYGCPYTSPDYKITDDGWVLGSRGERVLILPSLWRPVDLSKRIWNGQFLALVHGALPQAVILEFRKP